jgi:Rhomboid-like protein
MLLRTLARLARVRVTLAYAVIVTCVTIALYALGPQVQDRVIRHVSTNLHNLSHGHFGTLFGSAFVIDAGPIYVWLPGLVCLLAIAELMYRSALLVVAFATGHIGATLLVAVGLTASVEMGWLPVSVSRRHELRGCRRAGLPDRGDTKALAACVDRMVSGGGGGGSGRRPRFHRRRTRGGAGAGHVARDAVPAAGKLDDRAVRDARCGGVVRLPGACEHRSACCDGRWFGWRCDRRGTHPVPRDARTGK